MDGQVMFPKRLTRYVNETGVRALDRLADQFEAAAGDTTKYTAALQTLSANWKGMSAADKEKFVSGVATYVIETIIASAALPTSIKLGKKVVRKSRKIIRKQSKKLRKASRRKTADAPVPQPKKRAVKKK
jgi:hypothetical protein